MFSLCKEIVYNGIRFMFYHLRFGSTVYFVQSFSLVWLRFHVELIKNFGHFNYVQRPNSMGVSYLSIGLIILTLINCMGKQMVARFKDKCT